MKTRIGIFGDSYAQPDGTWTQHLARIMPDTEVDIQGLGGTNQYYALDRWWLAHESKSHCVYDFAVFTFTWHNRLFHSWPYRNDQFRCYSEQRPFCVDDAIVDEKTNREFLETIPKYFQYIYDDRWAMFNHEMIVRYILQDLPRKHPDTRFIFIPNTEISRQIAKQNFESGLLLDFAFEEISNREPGSPGPMPVLCARPGHLNETNHRLFAELMHSIITNYHEHSDCQLPVNLDDFDVVKTSD